MSTVLALAQKYARRKGIEVPSALFGSTDAALMQLLEIIEMTGFDLWRRMTWQATKRRKTFAAVAAEDQGLISSIIGSDCAHIIPDTLWDDTQRIPIFGPRSDPDWQAMKALVPQGPLYQSKVYEGHLYISGPPIAGHTFSCFYKSRHWLSTAEGLTPTLTNVAADTNVPMWEDDVFLLGVDAFWRREKSLPYTQQMADYEAKIADISGNDSIRPVISMHNSGRPGIKPGIVVPAGNWSVS